MSTRSVSMACVAGSLDKDSDQVTTCAVKGEEVSLLELLGDVSALGVLAHEAEEMVEMREMVVAAQIVSEKVEACPPPVRHSLVTWISAIKFALLNLSLDIQPSTIW